MFGHPSGMDGGVWARGRLVDVGGPVRGWVQIDGVDSLGRAVAPGFSGAGVLDDGDWVIGLLVSRDRQRDARVAWMMPTETVAAAFEVVAAAVADLSPPRLPSVTAADVQRLAHLLSELPLMRDERTRQDVVDALRPEVSRAIPRRASVVHDVYSIVVTCRNYPGGLRELMKVVRWFGGESTMVRTIDTLLTEMGMDEE
jgi:hypothetical protein